MDAEHLAMPDASFDVVVAQYVVTAIPNPERALDEFVRVVRPGGEIIMTTRIGAEKGLRGTLEKWLMPLTSRLGWRTEFSWAALRVLGRGVAIRASCSNGARCRRSAISACCGTSALADPRVP